MPRHERGIPVQCGVFRPRLGSKLPGKHAGAAFWLRRCLLLLLPAFGLAGCSFHSSPPLKTTENTLRLPWYGSPRHFDPGIVDPARASSSTSFLAASLVNVGLVKFSPDLHVIPELAVSIPTISTDGRSYTFTIRQDARFADGSPCTAADVAYSFARALSPAEHSRLASSYLGGIEGAPQVEAGLTRSLTGVQIVHRLTVRIHLAAPDATFLEKLAFPVAAIGSSHGAGGLGPFVRVRSSSAAELTFVPRPHYYGGAVQLSSVRLVAVPNAAAGLDLYRKGQLEAAWVPPDRMPAYVNHAQFSDSDALDGYFAVAPPAEGKQLAGMLDRTRLLSGMSPFLASLESIVPPAIPDYVSSPPAIGTASAPSDPPVRLAVSQPQDTFSQRLRAALVRQWGSRLDATRTVWILHDTFLLPDPGRWLGVISGVTPAWYRHALANADALTNDPVSRMSAYSDLENWALAKGIIIPLASSTVGYVTRPDVQGLEVTALGLMPANNSWSVVGLVPPG